MNYFEYTTLEDFRGEKLPTETTLVNGSGDGAMLLRFIREVSEHINKVTERNFAPIIATRYFDAITEVDGAQLLLNPYDLLAVGTVTNGDGITVASSSYVFEPRHAPPYYALTLKTSTSLCWTYSTDNENAISLNASTWGYHTDYANAWESIDTIAANSNTTVTTLTLTTGAGNPGDLLKIDSEYLYLSARNGTSATVIRGVNGSTAATHTAAAPVSRWIPIRVVAGLCMAGVVIRYAIRENPQVENITVDNHVIATPKDWRGYVEKEIARLGLKRI